MTRKSKERPARGRKHELDNPVPEKFEAERRKPPITPKTAAQAAYLDALKSSEQVVAMGPAGTGKTWIAATYAADLLRSGKIERIIITRPNVACGRSLGFFPGTLEEKFALWAAPVIEAISERIGRAAVEIAIKNGDIEMVPFEVIRGRSWKGAFVLLDEAQNTTPVEMVTFLTRVGEDCRVVIDGDIRQSDLRETSGLAKVVQIVKAQMLPVPVIEFQVADVVRSGWTKMWLEAFDRAGYM